MTTVSWQYRTDIEDDKKAGPPEAFVRFVWAISPKHHATALDQAEEHRLVAAAQAGSTDAAERLMAAHERFLIAMANKVARQSRMQHLIEDLRQTALTEFMASIERYSPDSDARLATFARYRVGGALLRQALDFRYAMSIGKSSDERKAYFNMRAAIDSFKQTHGRKPDPAADMGDLAGRLGVSPKAWKRGALAHRMSTLPLHKIDLWVDGDTDCPDVDREQVRTLVEGAVAEVMGTLKERDRTILSAFVADPDAFDGTALAKRFGITPERVGQIRRGVLGKIKQVLDARGLSIADLMP